MPVRLADLQHQRRMIDIPVTLAEGENLVEETVKLIYNPGAITEQMFGEFRTAQAEQDENSLNKLLSRIAVEWDVIGLDEQPIPFLNGKGPHPDLSLVPIPFKSAVLSAIMEDVVPNRGSASSSGAGLSRKGK